MPRDRVSELSLTLWRTDGWVLGRSLDVLGVALGAAAMAWTLVAGAASGGDPAPVAGAFLAAVVGVVIGRMVGGRRRWVAPAAVVLGVALLFTISGADLVSGSPTSGPFGYANATGGMAALGATAALMVAAARRGRLGSGIAALAAVAFGAVPFLVQSLTPAVLVLGLPVAGLAARDVRWSRVIVAVAGLIFLAVLAVTIVLGSHGIGRAGTVDEVVDATLTERRVALWSESLEIMKAHPVSGVGPGRFALVSPTARGDRDASWAHNEFLQQGAEQGIPGLLLIVAIFLWGFCRLWVRPSPDVITALAAVGLAILGIHACVDYVLHFPALPVTVALLVGAGIAGRGFLEEPDAW